MDIGTTLADTLADIINRQEKCLFGQELKYNVATN